MTSKYDSNLELSILSCVLNKGNSFYEIQDIVEPKTFYWLPNRNMWEAIIQVADNDLYIDKVTVINQMEKNNSLSNYFTEVGGVNGRDAVEYIVSMNSNSDFIESYAVQLSEAKSIRDIMDLSDRAKELAMKGKSSAEILSILDVESGKISGNSGAILSSLKGLGSALEESVQTVMDALKGDSKYIETGLEAIDNYIGGGYPGRLYIVGAASNDGKSALMTDIAYNVSISDEYLFDKNKKSIPNRKPHKVGFITLEMSAKEVVHRFVQIKTGIDPIRLEQGKVTEAEIREFEKSIAFMDSKKENLIFEDTPEMNISQLRQKIRKMVAEGCDFFIVDQLQQIQPMQSMANLSRHVIYDFITYRLKAFSREFNVPIFLAHQLNRSADQSQNKTSELSLANLNEGGERAADAILFIRHEKKNQEILSSWFHWVKNRQGRKGRKQVDFIGQHILFKDTEDDSPDGFKENQEHEEIAP